MYLICIANFKFIIYLCGFILNMCQIDNYKNLFPLIQFEFNEETINQISNKQ